MRVDGGGDVGGFGTHLDGERDLADQLAGVGADDAAADDVARDVEDAASEGSERQ